MERAPVRAGMAPPEGSQALHEAHGGARPRVLVADDDGAMRSLLRVALSRSGFEVEEARDGTEVLRFVRAARLGERPSFDLLVTDVRMPGGSGLDLLRSLRALDVAVPVILITAFGTDDLHAEGRRGGADAVIDKPFSLDTLIDQVRRCLHGGAAASARSPTGEIA